MSSSRRWRHQHERRRRHNIDVAKQFYGETLGLEEGRSSTKWQDYAMHGHQVVVHWSAKNIAQDYVDPVDGDEVPVPHFGLQMPTYELWKDVVDRVKAGHSLHHRADP